jgi:hypothetical protein
MQRLSLRVLTYPLADLEAVHDRQHDVSKSNPGSAGDGLHGFLTAESHDGFVAVLLHQDLKGHDNARLVITMRIF